MINGGTNKTISQDTIKKLEKKFEELVSMDIYQRTYNALYEMGASTDIIKAFEAYKGAPLKTLNEGVEWVKLWQQAIFAEIMKEAYLLSERQQANQTEKELLSDTWKKMLS